MKYIVLMLAGISLAQMVMGRQCGEIKVDLKKGTVNKLKLNASQDAIKKKYPVLPAIHPTDQRSIVAEAYSSEKTSFIFTQAGIM